MDKPQLLHHHQITISQDLLDRLGHVNHARYLDLFEQARWAWLKQQGLPWEKLQQHGFSPVVLEVTIRYHKELVLNQTIDVHTFALSNVSEKIFRLSQEMVDSVEKKCAHILVTFGLIDLKQRKLIKPPQIWLDAFAAATHK